MALLGLMKISSLLQIASIILQINTKPVLSDGGSLTFVFDTGRIKGDIKQILSQVTNGTTAILKGNRNFDEFVLVPFGDSAIGPVYTNTFSAFMNKLQKLESVPVGNCQDSSIEATIEGLHHSKPQSYIFVFTDGTAKSAKLVEEAISLAQEQKSKVIFLLTGDCGKKLPDGYKSYQQIAAGSAGELFSVDETDLEKVLASFQKTVRSDEVHLLSISETALTTKDTLHAILPLDSMLEDVILKFITERNSFSIQLADQNGTHQLPSETILSLPNAMIQRYDKLEPGNWSINYVSNQPYYSLRLTGKSEIDFDVKFGADSSYVNFNEAFPKPITGIPLRAYIRISGLEDGVLENIRVTSLNGTVLAYGDLQSYQPNVKIYVSVTKNIFPDEPFHIQVYGKDKNGFELVRSTKLPIIPINAPGLDECTKCATNGTSRCMSIPGTIVNGDLTQGRFRCVCKSPYFKGDGKTCENVDECLVTPTTKLHNCDNNAVCTDTYGRWRCDCKAGFSGNGNTCKDINECVPTDRCAGTGNCTNSVGSFSCDCNAGYKPSNYTAPLCEDIDECDVANGDCQQQCNNTAGSFRCECFSGYEENLVGVDNRINCTEIDECARKIDGCEQECINTPGSFICNCSSGYRNALNGINCTDIDECKEGAANCPANSLCKNSVGDYSCPICEVGYEWEDATNTTCIDIDECLTEADNNCTEICINTIGSFECKCIDGHEERDLLTDGKGYNCIDIDECAKNSSLCEQNCVNLDSYDNKYYYRCECKTGYREDGPPGLGTNCTEINECTQGSHNCTELHKCVNTAGSFECQCKPGYTGNETTCTNIDECTLDTHNCDSDAICSDNEGSYNCTCKANYEGNGTVCIDVDECLNGTDNCSKSYGICTNTPGGFNCSCIYGYSGDGVKCGEVQPSVIGLHNRTQDLNHLAELLKANSLEVMRRKLEIEKESLLRRCALQQLKQLKERRQLIGLPPIESKDLSSLISTLQIVNAKLQKDVESLKKVCGL